jgi:hypothetical protein
MGENPGNRFCWLRFPGNLSGWRLIPETGPEVRLLHYLVYWV